MSKYKPVIKLCDISKALCESWEYYFKDYLGGAVEVHNKSFKDVQYDAIVSPGNSFGFMDGGLDGLIEQHYPDTSTTFGAQRLVNKYMDRIGECNVGSAFSVTLDDANMTILIYAPTMRIPMDIRNTDNVYVSTLAALQEISKYPTKYKNVGSVLLPGMGTGAGRVPPMEAARQMFLAFKRWNEPKKQTWKEAIKFSEELGCI